jgi:hypothetical protein
MYLEVRLVSADLRGAVGHSGAKFTDADLRNMDLTGADLTEAILTDARWPEKAPVPKGWVRDSGSAKLRQSRSDANDSSA